MKNKWAVFIVGPTGVGKTDLSIDVAESLHTEIISADSRQVYRELSIGTAIPPEDQLKRIKHHLIQHRSVTEYYNASMFEEEALQCMHKLLVKYPAVVVTGGSGLYLKAICEGIDDIPSVDPQIRKELFERMEREGIGSLRFELRKLDPDSYKNIDLRNPNRVLKALEVTLGSGMPYSSFLTREKKTREFDPLKIGLNMEREVLYDRVNRRVEEMMEMGLLNEVKECLPYREMNALKTVGYRELFEYLDGKCSLPEAVERIKRNSRRYVRRQLTWFHADPDIRWFRPDQKEEIIKHIKNATGQ